MSATATEVINVAKTQLGKYYPGNSPYGVWYGDKVGSNIYNSAQFCAMGLSWCADKAKALDIIPLHAYTPSGVNWFKSKGQWHAGTKGIKRGDIVYFDFPGLPLRVSHVGIVESVNSDGSVNTIEFNTSGTAGGDQRNGRVVARKRRKAYIVGYGRPKYKKTTTTSKLSKTGKLDKPTITALQKALGTTKDGVLSTPSNATKALQKMLNAKGYKGYNGKKLATDGYGLIQTGVKTNTIYALQAYLIKNGYKGFVTDGKLDKGKSASVVALQDMLNTGKFGK